MKNIFRLAVSAAAILLVIAACSKDQKVVKQLADGKWEVTDLSYDGVSTPDSVYANDVYEFEKCKVKKEDCAGTWTTIDPTKGEVVTSFTYSISDKGETITINIDLSTTIADIVESSDDKFVWSTTEDGTLIETTIEKI
ncbi:hypothetical protein N9545_01050 [Salibacteraceae bacterium]|jgi:hypothetical protein|nr:hypothetical protein [Salibacteraceae bacterium]MDB9709132.1 hypothetical protein [Salibacteraceae bacterium]HAQ72210.1 hypothetical protein [Flavobacteriales bacterium]